MTSAARARSVSGEQRDTIELPPANLRDDLLPELADALDEVGKMRGERQAARHGLAAAREAVTVAEAQDRQRAADHARGKLRQKPKLSKPKAEAEAEAAEERVKVLEVAAADAEAELALQIEGHRQAIAARLDEEILKRRRALREAVGRLVQREAEFQGVRGLAAWVSEPERGWMAAKFSVPTGITGPNRDPLALGAALAMIAEALAEPESQPQPANVQPLKPTAAGAARVGPR